MSEPTDKTDTSARWAELLRQKRALEKKISNIKKELLEENPEAIYLTLVSERNSVSKSIRASDIAPGDESSERFNLLHEADSRRAARIARENRVKNRRRLEPLAADQKLLDGLTMAMDMIRRGDTQVRACFVRGDLEAMLRITSIRRKLDLYGVVDNSEWALYCQAGLAEPETLTLIGEGDLIQVATTPSGLVRLFLKSALQTCPAGTDLTGLQTGRLVDFIRQLGDHGRTGDVAILTTYLNAKRPEWVGEFQRQNGARGDGVSRLKAGDESPYDVLGVNPGMSMSEISDAFIQQMQVVANLPNAAPQRRLIAAYKLIKAELSNQANPGPEQ